MMYKHFGDLCGLFPLIKRLCVGLTKGLVNLIFWVWNYVQVSKSFKQQVQKLLSAKLTPNHFQLTMKRLKQIQVPLH